MLGLVFAAMCSLRFAAGVPVRAVRGFIGGIGLQHTVKCSGEYTVDGVEHDGEMPVRSVPSDRRVEIEVLAADHEVVVSKSWLDIAFFRGGGIVLIGLAIGYGVRWIRLAQTATAELRG